MPDLIRAFGFEQPSREGLRVIERKSLPDSREQFPTAQIHAGKKLMEASLATFFLKNLESRR